MAADDNVRKGLNGLLVPAVLDIVLIVFFVIIIVFLEEPCTGTSIDALSLLHLWHAFIVVIVVIMFVLERLYQPVVIASLGVAAGAFDTWALVTRFMGFAGDECVLAKLIFDGVFLVTAFFYVLFAILSMSYYGCYGLSYVTRISTSKGSAMSAAPASSYVDVASPDALIAAKEASAPTTPLPRASASMSAHRRMLHKVHSRLVNE